MIRYFIALSVLAITLGCSSDSIPVGTNKAESWEHPVNRMNDDKAPLTIPAIDAEVPADYETATFGLG